MRGIRIRWLLLCTLVACGQAAHAGCLPLDGSWPNEVLAEEGTHQGVQGAWLTLKPDVSAEYFHHGSFLTNGLREYDVAVYLQVRDHCGTPLGDENYPIRLFVPQLGMGQHQVFFDVMQAGPGGGTLDFGSAFTATRTVNVQAAPTEIGAVPVWSTSISLTAMAGLWLVGIATLRRSRGATIP